MLSTRTTTLARRYAADFAAARPFRYVVMDDFFDEGAAARLLEQFPAFETGSARTESGTLGIGIERGLSPHGEQEESLVAFALRSCISAMHVDAIGAAVDLRCAQLDEFHQPRV